MNWYLIHTKPRQENTALLNLEQQGYECYLPMLLTEKLRQGSLSVIEEPLFPRYLFIRLDPSGGTQSWSPIRSTKGVSRLVSFGSEPAKVGGGLVEMLRVQEAVLRRQPQRHFMPGERVELRSGAFAGMKAIYQISDGERRVLVLIELLNRPVQMSVAPATLRKVG